jgi:alkylation response protein AidB-like acyl-CoA dehydrogenase
MDFDFSEEEQAISDLTQQIFEDKVTHEHLRSLTKSGENFDRELWRSLAKTGVVGATIHQDFQGAGLSFLGVTALLEKVGKYAAPIPALETIVTGALPIQEFGTESQKAEFLPKIAEGELIVTTALISSGNATIEDGQVSGSFDFVSFGLEADMLLLPTESGAFIVESGSPGITLESRETTTGYSQAALAMNNVGAQQLGTVSCEDFLAWLTLRIDSAICSIMAGACEASLNLASEYTKVRQQFDRAIATFQAVSQRAGDAYIDTEAVRLTSRQAAWRISAGLQATEQVAIARWWASEAGFRVVHAATHLHGGVGVDRDYPLHRYFLMTRQLELTMGNSEEQLEKLGNLLASKV